LERNTSGFNKIWPKYYLKLSAESLDWESGDKKSIKMSTSLLEILLEA
jgi:hypothetical protein